MARRTRKRKRRRITEDVAYDRQTRYINRHFGKDTPANLGWFVDDEAVVTKVYGHGYLTTRFDAGETEFEEF